MAFVEMIKDNVLGVLKFFFVEFPVQILGDLFEQPLLMWIFIGWGWASVWAMVTGFISELLKLVGA